MKLICKIVLLFLIANPAWAQKIIITYHQDVDRRDMVYEVLTENLGLPKAFIAAIEDSKPCQRRPDVILQICINDKGEIFFPVVRRDILKKSFKVFLKEKL